MNRTRRELARALLALPALMALPARAADGAVDFEVTAEGRRTTITVAPVVPQSSLEWKLLRLSGPDRLVLDLPGVDPAGAQAALRSQLGSGNLHVGGVRGATNRPGVARLVLELRPGVKYSASNLDGRAGVRVELTGGEGKEAAAAERPVVVAIDAGHGGKDPGAIGGAGTLEKEVALAIAQLLKSELGADPGMRPVLIRDTDVFVPLAERVHRARDAKADLFLSIHADAAPNREASGASVFALSEHGATSVAARLLAKKENDADLLGGIKVDAADPFLRRTLIDLAQTATIEDSLRFGGQVLTALRKTGDLHSARVEQAGFAVLKAPDFPSILVETAFISNREEEKRLVDPDHQKALAHAIAGGILAHSCRRGAGFPLT